ncbi:MAG: nitroreductase family protein [Syntrophales bacterium]|nr:nitroreductase family protein [Syntrophales bacterium]MDD5532318.1 nitroreductase family protein [Syntrophales bacterium]
MDLFTAIRERASCRTYSNEPVGEETLMKIIEAGMQAPSPANNQPWDFFIITRKETKMKIYEESLRCKKGLFEKSGWKWLDSYQVGFLTDVPVLIAVTGDPAKSGADIFLEQGGLGYQHACAAAIQNMLLAAHALGLGSLWYTLFGQEEIKKILGIDDKRAVVAIICIGKPARGPFKTKRAKIEEKIFRIS